MRENQSVRGGGGGGTKHQREIEYNHIITRRVRKYNGSKGSVNSREGRRGAWAYLFISSIMKKGRRKGRKGKKKGVKEKFRGK